MNINIYEMLKSGNSADYIRVVVEDEIRCATARIAEDEAAKKERIKRTRENLISAFEDYGIALTDHKDFLDEKTRAALEQVLVETEGELKDIEHDLKEIEKLKNFSKKVPKATFTREKSTSVSSDDAIIKDFIDKLI